MVSYLVPHLVLIIIFVETILIIMFQLNNKDNHKSSISLRVYVSEIKNYFKWSCGISVIVKNWDNKKERIGRVRTVREKLINTRLNDIESEFVTYIEILRAERLEITKDKLKLHLDGKFKSISKSENRECINVLYKQYFEEKKALGIISEGTNRRYRNIQRKIKSYKDPFPVSEFNNNFFHDFVIRELQEGNNNAYIHRQAKSLTTFAKWVSKKLKIEIDTETWRHKSETYDDQIVCTKSDLDVIKCLELEERLSNVRDVFLIGCYSGQRYSDYSVFNKQLVQGNFIVKVGKKTRTGVTIPLSGNLLQLLEKHEWKLPTISEQKFNKYIKEVFKLLPNYHDDITIVRYSGSLRIEKVEKRYNLVSSHTARRTFITIALNNGMPIPAVQSITGHRDIKSLMKYYRVDNNSVMQHIKRIFE